jgi:hypothetical protein
MDPREPFLPQRALLGLRESGRGTYRDPQPKKSAAIAAKDAAEPSPLPRAQSSLPGAQ